MNNLKVDRFNLFIPLATKLRAFKLTTPRRELSERGVACSECAAIHPEGAMKEQFGEMRCPECFEGECRLCNKPAEVCDCDERPQGDGPED
jgi:hypothetical protein